jgi:DNA-binding NarL/FixJ family response regulator
LREIFLKTGLHKADIAVQAGIRSVVPDPNRKLASKLKPKELRITSLVAQGLLYRQIAPILGTTEQVIKNSVKVVLDKTGADDRADLAIIYITKIKPALESQSHHGGAGIAPFRPLTGSECPMVQLTT